jgi:hypothetical protein
MTATYESIATTTLSTDQANVTFSSISANFTDLILVVNGTITSAAGLQLQFNGDTGNNYSRTVLDGNGSAASSGRQTSQPNLSVGLLYTDMTNSIIHFFNYSNTTTNKTVLGRANNAANLVRASVGLWRSTAAINEIKIAQASDIKAGTVFTLYGIKAE